MSIREFIRRVVRHLFRRHPARKASRPPRQPRPLQMQPLEDRRLLSGMRLLANWDPHPHLYADVWADGNIAYLGHLFNQGGVDIIDISDPRNPVLLSTFLGTGGDNELRDVWARDGVALFSSDHPSTGGVYVVDVSTPSVPRQLARITAAIGGSNRVHGFTVDGNHVYTVDTVSPVVRVFDISVPASPRHVRNITSPTGQAIHGVTVQDGRLYTAVIGGAGFVDIFDVRDVAAGAPLIASFPSGRGTHEVWPTDDGQYLAVAHEFVGGDVHLYDIRNPALPVRVSTIALPAPATYSAFGVVIQDNLMYVTWTDAGLRIFNIADPANPVLVADYDTFPGSSGGSLNGNWGVFPFFGPDRILASDITHGLFILSMDVRTMVTGPGAGLEPRVKVFDAPTQIERSSFLAFDPAVTGGVRVASGDVNRDGIPDVLAVTGPGSEAQVRLFDGTLLAGTPVPVASGTPYPGYSGGLFVAVGDLTGDGRADVVIAPDAGSLPAFPGVAPPLLAIDGSNGALLGAGWAYEPTFIGGVRVALSDVDGDGRADLVTTPGPGRPVEVKVLSGASGALLRNYLALEATFSGGAFVAAGDVDGDGRAEVVIGAGSGGLVRVFDSTADGPAPAPRTEFSPYPAFTGAVHVALQDVTSDGVLDILTAPGPVHEPRLKAFLESGVEIGSLLVYDPGFGGGVFVG